MVRKAERYPYSSHRTYLGMEDAGIVDVDPVLRRFGARKAVARERFSLFVAAGAKLGHQEQFYETESGVLGSEEFVDEMIHRIGEFDTRAAAARRKSKATPRKLKAAILIRAVEKVCGISRKDFCGPSKEAKAVFAKEALILSGRDLGFTATALSRIACLSLASVSRRSDSARQRSADSPELAKAYNRIIRQYKRETRES